MQLALIAVCTALGAQEKPEYEVPQVNVTALSDPVEKSYRKVIWGMDYFERARSALAPGAALRFKLLPRKRGTDMDHIVLKVIGSTFAYEVPIAADHTFVLERDVKVTLPSFDVVHSQSVTRLSLPGPRASLFRTSSG